MSEPKWEDTEELAPTWDDTSDVAAPVMQEEPGQLEAALRGAGQGLTFGFGDELAGGLGALAGGDYEALRDAEREANKAAAEAHPWTYHGADIASGFALPIGALGGFATKGASTLGKIARSAGSGALLGGLSGAGQSEAEDLSGVAKDTAIGAGVGAAVAPALEGGVHAIGGYLGKKANDITAIKDVLDSFKYGKQGVELTGADNLRKLTGEAHDIIENQVAPVLAGSKEFKNAIHAGGKEASDAAGRTVNISHFENLINKAEENGADPAVIAKLRRELGIMGKRQEVSVTDPTEYQKLADDKISEEMQKLRESAYHMQVKNAEKIGQRAYKDVERANKEILKNHIAELKIKYPGVEDSKLKALAEKELAGSGIMKDPSEAAQVAREKVIAEAKEAFQGTRTIAESVTGQPLSVADIGPNKRVIEDMIGKESGGQAPDLSGRAAKQIEKDADRNAALAYSAADKRNNDAIDKLANVYRDKQIMVSRQELVDQLKKEGKWLDPREYAEKARDEVRKGQKPVYIDQTYNMDVDRNMLTARSGDEDLLTRILPKYEFTKQQYQNPELGIRDVEKLRNFVSDIVKKDKGLDYRSLEEVNSIGKAARTKYDEMLGEVTAKAAKDTDNQVRNAMTELGVGDLVGDATVESKIELRDKLTKLIGKAEAAKGAEESVKLENAFAGLRKIYQDNPSKLAEVNNVYEKVKDKMRQVYLSDITTGHNTFAIDPTSINWTMTAAGKLGMLTNEAGLMINKIANSPVGKLLAQSKKFADKGYKKYSSAFEKMSSTDDINKRRALLYTLLQDPGFRNAMSEDIMGDDNAGN